MDLVMKLSEGLKTGKGVHMNRGVGPGIMGLGGERDGKGWRWKGRRRRWGNTAIGMGERFRYRVDRAWKGVRYSHSVIGPVCRGVGDGGGVTLFFIV